MKLGLRNRLSEIESSKASVSVFSFHLFDTGKTACLSSLISLQVFEKFGNELETRSGNTHTPNAPLVPQSTLPHLNFSILTITFPTVVTYPAFSFLRIMITISVN